MARSGVIASGLAAPAGRMISFLHGKVFIHPLQIFKQVKSLVKKQLSRTV